MKYLFTIVFIIMSILSLTAAITEKDEKAKINFTMLCAFNCALAPIVYKFIGG